MLLAMAAWRVWVVLFVCLFGYTRFELIVTIKVTLPIFIIYLVSKQILVKLIIVVCMYMVIRKLVLDEELSINYIN